MPECTCRGGNPNCFKCGGWGQIGNGAINSLIKISSKITGQENNKKSKSAQRTLHACYFCNKKFANLDQHISMAHPDEWLKYTKLDNINVENNLTKQKLKRCSECGVFMRNIVGHMAKVHGIFSENK